MMIGGNFTGKPTITVATGLTFNWSKFGFLQMLDLSRLKWQKGFSLLCYLQLRLKLRKKLKYVQN